MIPYEERFSVDQNNEPIETGTFYTREFYQVLIGSPRCLQPF